MITFTEEHAKLILEGRKRMTRRLWKKRRAKPGSLHLAKVDRFKPDWFAKLFIIDCWQEGLGKIRPCEAEMEGYDNVESFLLAFVQINGLKNLTRDELLNLSVWVVEFFVYETPEAAIGGPEVYS